MKKTNKQRSKEFLKYFSKRVLEKGGVPSFYPKNKVISGRKNQRTKNEK